MTRVCFFGAYDPAYPRNRILRAGLERNGIAVIEARVQEHRAFRRYPSLIAAFSRVASSADVLLVPEFRHKDVPLARALKGKRPLIFDPLVSRHDTLVHDWGLHREGGAQARWNRVIDGWALGHADRVLCDTWAHGELFARLGAPRNKLRRILVGAEDVFFTVAPPRASDAIRILYVGGFLPLHGVPFMIEALARLEREAARLPKFRATLVGKGIDHESAKALVERGRLERVELPGPRAYSMLPELLADADIVLGAFGVTAKAGRVIPHKVYQGLAAGRAVITGDGEAVREVFEPGVHLAAVPRGDANELARMLERLIVDAELRAALGVRGRERVREIGTVERIGADLKEVIEGRGLSPP